MGGNAERSGNSANAVFKAAVAGIERKLLQVYRRKPKLLEVPCHGSLRVLGIGPLRRRERHERPATLLPYARRNVTTSPAGWPVMKSAQRSSARPLSMTYSARL
jgi:hypothetical protein